MRRFAVRLPASVRVSGIPCEFPTEIENISACGMFFYLDRWMTKGAFLEVTMSFPPQVTLSEPMLIRFSARVVRVEPQTMNRVGVGVTIEQYEVVHSTRFIKLSPQGASAGS